MIKTLNIISKLLEDCSDGKDNNLKFIGCKYTEFMIIYEDLRCQIYSRGELVKYILNN